MPIRYEGVLLGILGAKYANVMGESNRCQATAEYGFYLQPRKILDSATCSQEA